VAWTVSQVLKTLIHLFINKKIVWERLIGTAACPAAIPRR
jgi:acid phosphatase family membrane protein YuiD